MDPLTITAAGGMRARLESLDLLANNIANASAAGYKADREFYNLYLSAEAAAGPDPAQSRLPLIESNWVDHAQGALQATGNPADLALSGPGFFAVEGPNGMLLTRGGALRVDAQGKLITREGYEFDTVEPRRIRADPRQPLVVAPDGTVRQNGVALGRLKVVEPADLQALTKRGHCYFALSGSARLGAARGEVQQGHIEATNQSPAEAAVRLVNVMRQFEGLQRALQIGGDLNRRAVEEVARVNG